MANDLKIIKRLRKEFGERLEKVEFDVIGYCPGGYVVDEENRVVGLNLRGKKLSKIPHEILKLSHLVVLILSINKIVDISSINELRSLQQLYLGYNQISDISALKDLSNLTRLDLRENKIKELPDEIVDLKMELKWEGYSGLTLKGNPLQSPPVEIVW
jgi:Leucine-rich repeat (LRR) protein